MAIDLTEITESDLTRMNRQRDIVRRAAAQFGVDEWPADARAGADILQTLIDKEAFKVHQTFELQALGVVFGDLLCSEGPFRWMIITDEYGHDPTLRWKATTITVHALTLISKRIEDGRYVDVQDMLTGIRERCEVLELGKAL